MLSNRDGVIFNLGECKMNALGTTGRIRVKSATDHGEMFTVRIPERG